MKGPIFYTTGDIARMLGMSPTTIFRAIEGGHLPASTTPGGHYRVSRQDLEAFMAKNKLPLSLLKPPSNVVLIVEDNPAELRMFKRHLQADPDLEVHGTESGYEAGFLTKSLRPKVVLLDIFLKDLDGREVMELIRSDPELKETRVIAITGATDPKDIAEIKACGVHGYIQKPVSAADLLAKVREYL